MSAATDLEAEAHRQAREGLRGPQKYLIHCKDCGKRFVFGSADSGANVYSMAGARETQITGMCEECFDALFEEDNE